jgi:hypothetical protein
LLFEGVLTLKAIIKWKATLDSYVVLRSAKIYEHYSEKNHKS